MKNLYRILFLLVLVLVSRGADATHVMGADMTYRQLDSGKYEIKIVVYRDCAGVEVGQQQFVAKSPSKTIYMGAQTQVSVRDVTGVGPNCGVQSACDSNVIPYGVEEWIFTDVLDLKNESDCQWTVSWEQCCRNLGITVGPANENFYQRLSFNKCVYNSSPSYTLPPVVFLLTDENVVLNMGALDTLDGFDSISFHLEKPLIGDTAYVTYSGSYSYLRPLQFLGFPNESTPFPGGFHLISETGDLLFRPTLANTISVFAIEVREYKKLSGTMSIVGKTRRDIQVIVLPNPNGQKSPQVSNHSHIIQSVCLGDSVVFGIETADSNASDSTFIYWNNGIQGATLTTTNGTEKNAGALFTWKPTSGDVQYGPHSFTVTVQDNSCPINRKIFRTYLIFVYDSLPEPVVQTGSDFIDYGNATSISVFSTIQNQYYRPAIWRSTGDGYFVDSFANNTEYIPGSQDMQTCSYTLMRGIWSQEHCYSTGGKWSDTMVVKKYYAQPNAGPNQEWYYGDTLFLQANWSKQRGQSTIWSSTGDGTFGDSSVQSTFYLPGPGDAKSCNWLIVLNTDYIGCPAHSDTAVIQRKMGLVLAGADQQILQGDTLFLHATTDTAFLQTVRWMTLGDGVFGDTLYPETWYLPGSGDLTNCGIQLLLAEFPPSDCYQSTDTLQYEKLLPAWQAGSNIQLFFGDTARLNASPHASFNYQFGYWTTAGDGHFIDSNDAETEYIPGTSDWANCGTTLYWNEIDHHCGGRTDSLRVLRVNTSVDAGGDQSGYYDPSLSFVMHGVSDTANGQAAYWTTNGDGSFNDSFDLNAIYTPGNNDLQNCEVLLTFTAYPAGSCTVFDEMNLFIQDSAVKILNAVVDSVRFDTVFVSIYVVASRSNLSWTTNGTGNFISASSTGVAYVLSAGDSLMNNLELIVENQAPCLTSWDTVRVNPTLRIPNGLAEWSIRYTLYPNPAEERIFLEWQEMAPIPQAMVYDAQGKEIKLTPELNGNIYSWDVSKLNKGLYVLVIQNDQGMRAAIKFMVK